jgi:hypothetical protein
LKDETKTSAGQHLGLTEKGAVPPSRVALPTMGPTPLGFKWDWEDRFRSTLCLAGKHEECEHSSLLGICGCECHDWLDDLENDLTEEMN